MYTDMDESESPARLRLVPPISRARDFRLYTPDGHRLVDLWQYGGRAILGHTPPSVLREMKNTAERGLFAPFPGPQERRFLKALSALFPGRFFRVFPGDAALYRFLKDSGVSAAAADPAVPAALPADVPPGGPQPALWRPFLDGGDGPASGCREAALPAESAAPFLIPVLPFPWAGAPRVLAFGAADAVVAASAGETLSPVILAAAARAVYNLIAALGQGRPPFQKISRALSQNSPWKRRGVYLSLSVIPDGEGYTALFRRFLDAGYLLPPRPGEPAILPGILSPGEEAGLAALLNS